MRAAKRPASSQAPRLSSRTFVVSESDKAKSESFSEREPCRSSAMTIPQVQARPCSRRDTSRGDNAWTGERKCSIHTEVSIRTDLAGKMSPVGGPTVKSGLPAHVVLSLDGLQTKRLTNGVVDRLGLALQAGFTHKAFDISAFHRNGCSGHVMFLLLIYYALPCTRKQAILHKFFYPGNSGIFRVVSDFAG